MEIDPRKPDYSPVHQTNMLFSPLHYHGNMWRFFGVSRSHLHQMGSFNSPNNDANFEIVRNLQGIMYYGLLGKIEAFSVGPPSSGTTFHCCLLSPHELVSFLLLALFSKTC